MCLYNVTNIQDTLKTLKTVTIDSKKFIVGYKIVSRKKIDGPACLLPLVQDTPRILSKWNRLKKPKPVRLLSENEDVDRKKYLNGFHIYLNKIDVLTFFKDRFEGKSNSTAFNFIAIPVYFRPDHVIATGEQRHRISAIVLSSLSDEQRLFPVAVAKAYYIKPSDYKKAINAKSSKSLIRPPKKHKD